MRERALLLVAGLAVLLLSLPARADTPSDLFRPPRRPPLPQVQHASWARNPVDGFVLAGLEAKGLEPSPPAERLALLRRVTVDLTGLPPTLQEQQAFLADISPDAYRK